MSPLSHHLWSQIPKNLIPLLMLPLPTMNPLLYYPPHHLLRVVGKIPVHYTNKLWKMEAVSTNMSLRTNITTSLWWWTLIYHPHQVLLLVWYKDLHNKLHIHLWGIGYPIWKCLMSNKDHIIIKIKWDFIQE